MVKIIGISGKPGSNKLIYGFCIARELTRRGYSVGMAQLAKPLYDELDAIVKASLAGASAVELDDRFQLDGAAHLIQDYISRGLGDYNENYGYSRRNENVRRLMNLLGTSIRRKQDPAYFLRRLEAKVQTVDFAVVTDLRFPNEADSIRLADGMTIRVNVALDDNRGGFKYEEGLRDETETALDAYPLFDYHLWRQDFNGREFGRELESFFGLPYFVEPVR